MVCQARRTRTPAPYSKGCRKGSHLLLTSIPRSPQIVELPASITRMSTGIAARSPGSWRKASRDSSCSVRPIIVESFDDFLPLFDDPLTFAVTPPDRIPRMAAHHGRGIAVSTADAGGGFARGRTARSGRAGRPQKAIEIDDSQNAGFRRRMAESFLARGRCRVAQLQRRRQGRSTAAAGFLAGGDALRQAPLPRSRFAAPGHRCAEVVPRQHRVSAPISASRIVLCRAS